ncbi:MAG: DUF4445 domain-containing protein [Armatimonadia bacterium]|nr:DUF4445 domain-containing protein [Armatimonadia bacterium]
MDRPREYILQVTPAGRKVRARSGESILSALGRAGVHIFNPCGGDGTCGRCLVLIKDSPKGEARQVLACQEEVGADLHVHLPSASRMEPSGNGHVAHKAGPIDFPDPSGSPRVRAVPLDVASAEERAGLSDWDALEQALADEGVQRVEPTLSALTDLPSAVREDDGSATAIVARSAGDVDSLTAILPASEPRKVWGLAVDLGTTGLTVALADLDSGETLGCLTALNPQVTHGPDVISRIIAANRGGVREQQELAAGAIEALAARLCERRGGSLSDVHDVVVSGNPTMIHLLVGLPPKYLRLAPYVPVAHRLPPLRAWDMGLELHPEAQLRVLPGISSYVGGDIVAGVLATGLDHAAEPTLLVDLGTNGEMVMGCADWMMGTAASAGPCLEGGGIECGGPAVPGAVEAVTIADPEDAPGLDIIGDASPDCVCGTGLVDLVAELQRTGVVTPAGELLADASPRVGGDGSEAYYRLVTPSEAQASGGRELHISQTDIRNLIQAKGAIFAAVETLATTVGMDLTDIGSIMLAGGLGSRLDAESVVRIGLMPDVPRDRIHFVGNTSLGGAMSCLLHDDAGDRAEEIASGITPIDLGQVPEYMDSYTASLFLPHTDQGRFPSVARGAEEVTAES